MRIHILKYIIVFVFVLLSGCASYPGQYYYQSYANDPAVQKAYKQEQAKMKVEEKSIAKCVARNQARIDVGFAPGYFCGSSYYGGYGYGGYGGYGYGVYGYYGY